MASARTKLGRPPASGSVSAKASGTATAKTGGARPASSATGGGGAVVGAAAGGGAGAGRDRAIDGLTKQLREALASWNDADAASRVLVGEVLSQAKAKLAHGMWLGWVEANVPHGVRWVQLSMELAVWSQDHPAMFERVRGLGSAKVTELMRLRLDQLEALLARRDHLVPSTGQRVTLVVMTVAELKEVLRALSGKRPKAAGAFDQLIARARGSANKTIESIQWMIQHKHAVSQELAEDIHDDLAQALSSLEEAFGLDADE